MAVGDGSVNTLLTPLLMAENYSNGMWRRAPHLAVVDYEFRNLLDNPDVDMLIIRGPPRHGKSEYMARWAQAWYHLTHPYATTILSSYNASLAKEHGQWVRDTVHRLAPLFNLKGISPRNAAKGDWKIEGTGGGMLACGLRGGQTGRGGNLITIDDYIRGVEQANSEGTREAIWDWFRGTISTRREPGGKIMLFCTQWSADDLIGRIMQRRDELGLKIRSITLQAIKEDDGKPDPLGRLPGVALWPERFSFEYLNNQRKLMGEYWFSAQYQGNPRARSGNLFKWRTDHIIAREALPQEFDSLVRFWDRAATAGGGCYSCGVLIGKAGKLFYVVHVFREQMSATDIQASILRMAISDQYAYGQKVLTAFEREGGSSGPQVSDLTVKELVSHGCRVEAIRPVGNKEYRAEPLATAVSNDLVRIVRDEWTIKFMDSTGQFPYGKFKDDTDAASSGYLELVNPTSKRNQAAVVVAARGPRDAQKEEMCICGCKHPREKDFEVCCELCLESEGAKHTPKCVNRYNDWYVKNSRDL